MNQAELIAAARRYHEARKACGDEPVAIGSVKAREIRTARELLRDALGDMPTRGELPPMVTYKGTGYSVNEVGSLTKFEHFDADKEPTP
ncbi:MAG: hypothetical protein WC824_09535 [Bacteroidota bacterium]|jgi:hypothetical protein